MTRSTIDQLVYGHDPLTHIVAAEPDGDRNTAVLFRRLATGETEETSVPYSPWLLTDKRSNFDGAITSLMDGWGYNYRIDFSESGWRGFQQAKRSLQDTGSNLLSYGSQTKQFLTATGITLFKDMSFNDLRRLQLDIETTTLSPYDRDAKVLLAALSDTTDRIEVLAGDETEILEDIADRIRRWDPDVIEGHNIFGFDLPYLIERCRVLGVQFNVGRGQDKSPIVGSPRNCAIGANSRPFTPIYVYGRHVIDTYLQVQRFDAPKGQISSYGLKECARVYNIASENRIIVDRTRIREILRDDPSSVVEYARQDVDETKALADLICVTDFYQTTMMPDVYQSVAVTGSGEKVNSLLVREYIRRGHAIPLQQQSSEYPGGYTEVRRVGVVRPVVKTDVESLYPSLMLTQLIKPKSDKLEIFLPLLDNLTQRRLSAKSQAKAANYGTLEYSYWDGLQNSYKVLINSFYGYIGGPFHFNDYQAAREVTLSGQRIVRSIADRLEETGSRVIEIDTDGIYFQPPEEIKTEALEEAYIAHVASVVPDGIRLAHDGRYRAMLSLKIKNYVLVGYDGKKIMKGSSLRSRADEQFGREFLSASVDLLIEESYLQVGSLYKALLTSIQEGSLPIEQLSRRERVTVKMRDGARRGLSELIKTGSVAIGDLVQVYNRNDGSIALASDYNFDEDREHYANKLYKFALRLIDGIGEEKFLEIIPKPKPAGQRLQERLQSTFDF